MGVAVMCAALALARATYYRRQRSQEQRGPRPTPPRALSTTERAEVLALLHEPRFADQAPAEVYATLLEEDRYIASVRTMYRVLAENAEVRDRRNQLRHPNHKPPELLATGPNQVWSWDITKLQGPVKWSYFYLYVVMDVFSRYVVAWMVAPCESATLATRLIETACERQGIQPGALTIHADRGTSMTSKTLALKLADLGVTKTHSRPHVSDDNPYSEAQFRTLKYRPDYPERFGCIEDARSFCEDFFRWYNHEHHHSGISLLTPHDLHSGRGPAVIEARTRTLAVAYAAHPERFVRGEPKPAPLPVAAWINKPKAAAPDLGRGGPGDAISPPVEAPADGDGQSAARHDVAIAGAGERAHPPSMPSGAVLICAHADVLPPEGASVRLIQ